MRRAHITLVALFLVTLCFFLNFVYLNGFVNNDSLQGHEPENQAGYVPGHLDDASLEISGYASVGYDLVILINSKITEVENRQLLRKELFSLPNNLTPCLNYNGRIYYKFFVTEGNIRNEKMRQLRSEIMEYNDVVILPQAPTWGKEHAMLKWANSVEGPTEFRHVMLLDSHTFVRFDQVLSELDYMIKEATEEEKNQPILWGNLLLERNQTQAIIMSASLTEDLLNIPDLLPPAGAPSSIISHILDNRSDDLVAAISIINDKRFTEWPNNPYVLPKNTLAVSMVYQADEFAQIASHFKTVQPPLCTYERPQTKIGVITSSFIYKDNCMIDAGLLSATNKRDYAKKHDYYFIARSTEFAQQVYRGRRIVWGKIDAIEKVLPEYDWLLWLDMDAVIMNDEIRVEDIMEHFQQELGDEEFSKKSLFITKPRKDPMFNAGVFLLRNSQWSFNFLREVQHRQDSFNTLYYEQKAMWNVARDPEWAEGAHIFGDANVFNTFPDEYVAGNFVAHFAPAGCPAEEVMNALTTHSVN
ncbi:hypothetical protein K7432_013783 [Basidiobolus ranarum]|uniref:Uncharacterized protein n=1 Tax=Basidiobolus ranarum TaxID=34480 RepID=A0ABR2WIV7_9FUNG